MAIAANRKDEELSDAEILEKAKTLGITMLGDTSEA
jgi:hypothetical protein